MITRMKREVRVESVAVDMKRGIEALVKESETLRKEYDRLRKKGGDLTEAEKHRLKELEALLKKNAVVEMKYRQDLSQTEKVLRRLSRLANAGFIKKRFSPWDQFGISRRGVKEQANEQQQMKTAVQESVVFKKRKQEETRANSRLSVRATTFANKFREKFTFGIKTISGISPEMRNPYEESVGEDDGVTYRNVPYRGMARTGYVLSPTLVGERGDELVVDNPTLRNIRMNAPYILSEIMRLRVPQRAEGKYDSGMGTSMNDPMSELISRNTAVMANMASFLRSLQENGVKAPIVLSELEKKQALSAKSKKIGTM